MTKEDFELFFGPGLAVSFFLYEGKEGYVSKNYDEAKKTTMYVLFFDGKEMLEYDENKITKAPFINGKSLEDVMESLEYDYW